ncbi:GroES-like protein [Xylaria cf. heliscus]|nr:GroES-like protein [Xylaria cf. heliscus]
MGDIHTSVDVGGLSGPLPKSHRAIVEDTHGQPTLKDVALPLLLPGTLLVKSKAVALNPFDFKMGARFPVPGAVVGTDFAGEIVQMHDSVEELRPDLKVGDLVCGLVHGSNHAHPDNGAFADYIRAPASLVIKFPKELGALQASTFGAAMATTWLALWGHLSIPASPSQPTSSPFDVLVYGGSTCCGTMAIQLLKLSGVRVVTTCSPKNFTLVKEYGADACFDYADPGTSNSIRDYTGNRLRYALDCIADADSVDCCYTAIGRAGGKYACLELVSEELQTRNAIKSEFVMVLEIFGEQVEFGEGYDRDPNPERYKDAVRWYREFQALVEAGKIVPHRTECLTGGFGGIIEGLRRLKTGTISGRKLVVQLS